MAQLNIEEEKIQLVLARFRTLNPESKLLLGNGTELTVRELIKHIESQDDLGKKAVDVQIKMLKLMTGAI